MCLRLVRRNKNPKSKWPFEVRSVIHLIFRVRSSLCLALQELQQKPSQFYTGPNCKEEREKCSVKRDLSQKSNYVAILSSFCQSHKLLTPIYIPQEVPYPKPTAQKKFSCLVQVAGQTFESFALCAAKRQACQMVARVALETLYPQFRDELSVIRQKKKAKK